MRDFLKKILCICLSLLILVSPVLAKEKIKAHANIQHDFTFADVPSEVCIKTTEDIKLDESTVIPAGAVITADIMQVQRERRWHKSGYILCKIKEYTLDDGDASVDLSERNMYLAVRKYEKINKKGAAILTGEIIITQAASIVGSIFIFFAPVDIAYFFAKGAIMRDRNPNWFKSGVSCAYDNSIFWFWLKGKPIELEKDGAVKIKEVKEKRALKLEKQIAKRNTRIEKRIEKKKDKLEKRVAKKDAKEVIKQEKRELKAAKLEQKIESNPKFKARYEKKQQKLAVKAQKRAAKESLKYKKKRLKQMKKEELI